MNNKFLQIYQSSKHNITSCLQKIKKDKQLYKSFIEIYQKTVYFKVKGCYIQALYNAIHNILQIPKYSDGGLKIFKNFNQGYYSQEDYNDRKIPIRWKLIKNDSQILKVMLKHRDYQACNIIKFSHVQKLLRQIYKENFDIIGKSNILMYYSLGLMQPIYCKCCGKFLKHPNISRSYCNKQVCKLTAQLKQNEYFQFLKNIFLSQNRPGFKLNAILKTNKKINQYVNSYLFKYFQADYIKHMSTNQKIYVLIYDIHEVPICKQCNKKHVRFDIGTNLYRATCGNICNNLYIDNIQKRLQKNELHSNIGKNQYFIINQLFPNNTFKKQRVGPFIPDFIDYQNKQIYQINQTYHLSQKKIPKDKRKYRLFS